MARQAPHKNDALTSPLKGGNMQLQPTFDSFSQDDQSWLGSAHGTDSGRPCTLKTSAFTAGTHYPNGYFPSGLPIGKRTSDGEYGPYAGRANSQQTVSITGATAGTFTLTLEGQTTGTIAWNATASTVQTALEGLPSINPGDVVVTGGALPTTNVVVSFQGARTGQVVGALTIGSGSLTGGTPTVAQTTAGGPGATDGTQVLAGFLFTSIKSPASSSTDVVGVLFEHGKVIASKLPIAIDAAGIADVAGRIIVI